MARRGSKPGERRGGRKPGTPNKVTHEIREIALAMVPSAVKALSGLLMSDNEHVRGKAVEIVLERAFGKAAQAVQHANAPGTSLQHDHTLKVEFVGGKA